MDLVECIDEVSASVDISHRISSVIDQTQPYFRQQHGNTRKRGVHITHVYTTYTVRGDPLENRP